MITLTQLQNATGATSSNAKLFLSYINETLDKFQINTPVRQLCFLAQVGHESGGLFYTEELASGTAYENRKDLGNTQPGDGIKFKGRGLIQITGRDNYDALKTAFNVDFISNPSLLGGKKSTVCTPEQLRYASWSAGWFWNKKNLNKYADLISLNTDLGHTDHDTTESNTSLDNFIKITKRINGGTNGLSDRVSRYNKGRASFVN